jgi:hypothetical protein
VPDDKEEKAAEPAAVRLIADYLLSNGDVLVLILFFLLFSPFQLGLDFGISVCV